MGQVIPLALCFSPACKVILLFPHKLKLYLKFAVGWERAEAMRDKIDVRLSLLSAAFYQPYPGSLWVLAPLVIRWWNLTQAWANWGPEYVTH